jgi:hypothetical protein
MVDVPWCSWRSWIRTGHWNACQTGAEVQLADDRLEFDVLGLSGCGVDPAIAHTAFVDLAPYTRAGP